MPRGLPLTFLLNVLLLLMVAQPAEARVLGEIPPQRPLLRHQVLQLALIRLRSQQDCLYLSSPPVAELTVCLMTMAVATLCGLLHPTPCAPETWLL